MTALTLLAFVGILALASMSEARLCRSQLKHTGQNYTGPKHCYNWTTPEKIQEQVYNDIASNYTVWSEISDETKKKKMVEEFRGMLRQIPKTEFEPIYRLHMTNITITSLVVPERLFKVDGIIFIPELSSAYLALSMAIPKFHITLSSPACWFANQPQNPCRVLYNLENIVVHLQTKWPRDGRIAMTLGKILNCQPESIKARLYEGRKTWPQKSSSRRDENWQATVNMVKSFIPTRNPNFHRLVKTFTENVFL